MASVCWKGSVASIKLAELCRELQHLGEVKVVVTPAAHRFVKALDMPQGTEILQDEDEWLSWHAVGDAVVHIELRRQVSHQSCQHAGLLSAAGHTLLAYNDLLLWGAACRWADVLVIAPLSANSMAKLAVGMCDNLLTCIVRAWDWQHRPLIVAPAMNTLMWESSFTAEHTRSLLSLGAVVVPPVAKTLACGDVGLGAMASPKAIAEVVKAVLEEDKQKADAHRGKGAWLRWSWCTVAPTRAGQQLPHGAERLTMRSHMGRGFEHGGMLIAVSMALGIALSLAFKRQDKQ